METKLKSLYRELGEIIKDKREFAKEDFNILLEEKMSEIRIEVHRLKIEDFRLNISNKQK